MVEGFDDVVKEGAPVSEAVGEDLSGVEEVWLSYARVVNKFGKEKTMHCCSV